jgi:hypothetical protein
MHTFDVSDVELGSVRLPRLGPTAGRTASNAPSVVKSPLGNPFVGAVHLAFSHHLPLALSPDDLWLCLAQGFATHVTVNAEALRSRFVQHHGKAEIVVRRDDLAGPAADWPGAIADLADQVARHVGKAADLVVADFSTTGPIERTASRVTLLDVTHAYFEYTILSLCGIPRITLLGTPTDWDSVRHRAAVLTEYGLEDWGRALLPVLDQFAAASRGSVDRSFWRSFYKYGEMSGGDVVTGWINVLFPYAESSRGPVRNGSAIEWDRGPRYLVGTRVNELPVGRSVVEFEWRCLGQPTPMVFTGGFHGVHQEPDSLTVRPVIGWAVNAR